MSIELEVSQMSILVAYATKYGSTQGIAEKIAATLRASGLTVDLQPVTSVRDVERYDACVIGSAVFAFHWMKPAVQFVERNSKVLAGKLVWLFSVGPLGLETKAAVKPRDFDHITKSAGARDHRIFFGAIEVAKLRGADKLMGRFFKGVEGDFRDWKEIEGWAEQIAQVLTGSTPAVAMPGV